MNILRAPFQSQFKILFTAVLTFALIGGPLIALAPASAALVDGAGTLACSTSGTVTVASNIVTGNTDCRGTVEIPASVTAIANNAFEAIGGEDFYLTGITFAAGSVLTSIGDRAFFQNRSLTSIVIPAGVTSIGSRAFQSTGALTTVTFAAGSALTTIGTYAFNEATALIAIEIPAGVATIGNNAFQITSNLKTFTFAGNALSEIGGMVFYQSGITSITIPAGVTSILGQAFREASDLSTVTFLGNAPTVVGDSPFTTSNSFDRISANAVAKVGAAATGFGITGSVWNNRLKVQREGDILCSTFGFFSMSGTTVSSQASCAGTAVIPATATHIGDRVFRNVTAVTSVTFATPSSLEVIGVESFAGMTGLTSIVIPASVLGISDQAFEGNTSLTSVVFAGNAVTLIGGSAFKNSTALTSIEIPDSVTAIGGEAFAGSSNLADVRFLGLSAPNVVVDTAFSGVKTRATATIFDGATGFSDVRSNWNGLIVQIANQTTVDCSGGGYFVIDTTTPGAPSLTQSSITCSGVVTVPAEVTFIEDNAFANIQDITSVVFEPGSALTTIGEMAFSGMNFDLTSVEFPAGVTHISTSAFAGAEKLEAVILPASLVHLGHDAFGGTGLLSVTFLGNAPAVGLDGANPGDPFIGVPALAKAYITEVATGFGDGPTWNGLTIVRAAAPYVAPTGSTGVTAPVVTPPIVVTPKPVAKPIALSQIVAKVLANGVPVLKGRSASKQVEFAASSARLDATDWATLRKVAAGFKGKKGKLILVGFVNGKGQSKSAAQKVAAARAKNVAMALVSLGVDFEIGYAGYGARNKAKPTTIDNRVDFRWIAKG